VIHAYTHTKGFLLLMPVGNLFLQICENLLLRICENFTTLALFVRTTISLLVRIAFLRIHSRNIPFTKSLMLVGRQNCPQCRAEDGWSGDATLGPQNNELINWFLPINWFRTHTHTQNSIFFTLHITRSETAANPELLFKPLLSWQTSTVDFSGLLWSVGSGK